MKTLIHSHSSDTTTLSLADRFPGLFIIKPEADISPVCSHPSWGNWHPVTYATHVDGWGARYESTQYLRTCHGCGTTMDEWINSACDLSDMNDSLAA